MDRRSYIAALLQKIKELWTKLSAKHLVLFLLAGGSVVFAVFLVRSWVLQTNQTVTCSSFIDERERLNGYLEIQLIDQHPIEPTFGGRIFVYSLDPNHAHHTSVNVRRSADRTYGASTTDIRLESSEQVFKGAHTIETRSRAFQDFSLIAKRGLHRYFPFDSSVFDFEVELDPPLEYQIVRLTNRVPGFIMQCEQVKTKRLDRGGVHVAFELRRSPLVQLSAIVLGAAGLFFLILIIRLEKVESLATSVASYFFALWSIRGIISSEIRVFPTLLDAWILTLCVLLIVLLTWRVAFRALGKK